MNNDRPSYSLSVDGVDITNAVRSVEFSGPTAPDAQTITTELEWARIRAIAQGIDPDVQAVHQGVDGTVGLQRANGTWVDITRAVYPYLSLLAGEERQRAFEHNHVTHPPRAARAYTQPVQPSSERGEVGGNQARRKARKSARAARRANRS